MMLAFAGSASILHLTNGQLALDRGDSLLRCPGMCYRTRIGTVRRPVSRYALIDRAAGGRRQAGHSLPVSPGPHTSRESHRREQNILRAVSITSVNY